MHPQAQGKGYSWRCYDIMASNACLVSSFSSELKAKTKGFVDLPMFNTPQEAREICKELLKDKSKREYLVAASQDFIEKNGRWIDRIREMEQILEITLITNAKKGSIKKLTFSPTDQKRNSSQRITIVEDRAPFNREHILSLGDRIQSVIINPILLLTLLVAVILNVSLLSCAKMGFFNTLLAQSTVNFMIFVVGSLSLIFSLLLEACIFYKFFYKLFRKLCSL